MFQCFLRCYLEKVGILTDEGSVDSKRAVEMLWSTSGDAIDDCVKEFSTDDEKGDGKTCKFDRRFDSDWVFFQKRSPALVNLLIF